MPATPAKSKFFTAYGIPIAKHQITCEQQQQPLILYPYLCLNFLSILSMNSYFHEL